MYFYVRVILYVLTVRYVVVMDEMNLDMNRYYAYVDIVIWK